MVADGPADRFFRHERFSQEEDSSDGLAHFWADLSAFVREQVRLDTPKKSLDGRTTRQAFRDNAAYRDHPDINGVHENPAITYVWRLREDVALTPTGGGGMSSHFWLSQHDIGAYMRNMGITLDPFFIRALILADRIAINARIEHQKELGDE